MSIRQVIVVGDSKSFYLTASVALAELRAVSVLFSVAVPVVGDGCYILRIVASSTTQVRGSS